MCSAAKVETLKMTRHSMSAYEELAEVVSKTGSTHSVCFSPLDRAFLLNAPISPSGLFYDAVRTVVDRFQEVTKQSAAFKQYLPCRSKAKSLPPVESRSH